MQACYDKYGILELMGMQFPLEHTWSRYNTEKTLRWLKYLKHWCLSSVSTPWTWHFEGESE